MSTRKSVAPSGGKPRSNHVGGVYPARQTSDVVTPQRPPPVEDEEEDSAVSSCDEEHRKSLRGEHRKSRRKAGQQISYPEKVTRAAGHIPSPAQEPPPEGSFRKVATLDQLHKTYPYMLDGIQDASAAAGTEPAHQSGNDGPKPETHTSKDKKAFQDLSENPLRDPTLFTELKEIVQNLPNVKLHVSMSVDQANLNQHQIVDRLCEKRITLPITTHFHNSRVLYQSKTWRLPGDRGELELPACSFGDDCIGRTAPIAGMEDTEYEGATLMAFLFPEEWARAFREVVVPRVKRPCLLDIWRTENNMIWSRAAHPHNATVSPDTCFQRFRCLMDTKGGYHRRYMIMQPSKHYSGFVSPVVLLDLSTLRWEYDTRVHMWRINHSQMVFDPECAEPRLAWEIPSVWGGLVKRPLTVTGPTAVLRVKQESGLPPTSGGVKQVSGGPLRLNVIRRQGADLSQQKQYPDEPGSSTPLSPEGGSLSGLLMPLAIQSPPPGQPLEPYTTGGVDTMELGR
jgi:hypothetical protein